MTTVIKPFNEKAQDSITNTGEFNAWEGAVRSGKTFASLLGWSIYIINSPEKTFLMSGATMGSISRNCLIGDYGFIAITGARQRTDTDGSKYLEFCKKRIYYVGSNNKRSFEKIRGMTIGGWYADEINLHDPDFINEALNRSLASKDRKNFWTLNPSNPQHFIYVNYLDKYIADDLIDMRYHHFTMIDNPAITDEARERFARQYKASGMIYYNRFILGLRVNAEGSIYPEFDRAKHVKELPKDVKPLYANIGSDIGGSGSATSYVCTLFYYNKARKLCIHVPHEFYDKDNYSTESILDNFRQFSKDMLKLYIIDRGYSDSAEQLILKSMKAQGLIDMQNSKKIAIMERIRLVKYLLAMGRLTISPACPALIDALEGALWNSKSTSNKDERLDDGSVSIDPLDSFEYSIERKLNELMEN